MEGSYKNSYMDMILNYEQNMQYSNLMKKKLFLGFWIFPRNTCSHLAEFQCSAEHRLRDAGLGSPGVIL